MSSVHLEPTTPARPLLVGTLVCVVGDAALLAADIARRLGVPAFSAWFWNTEQDRGLAEIFGAGKLLVAAVLLLVLRRRLPRSAILVVLALVLVVVVLDDHLRLHEDRGSWLARMLAEVPGLEGLASNSMGEILVFAALGAPLLLAAAWAYLRSAPRPRRIARHVVGGLAVLALSAVVIDGLGPILAELTGEPRVAGLARFVENAGELVASSIVLVVVLWHLWGAPGRSSRPAVR